MSQPHGKHTFGDVSVGSPPLYFPADEDYDGPPFTQAPVADHTGDGEHSEDHGGRDVRQLLHARIRQALQNGQLLSTVSFFSRPLIRNET